ncbi:unnamed protein product [marine sediment metagenome]|uniref:Uncharacterized protein n=1 Tax=marine sediment metagenome TaxID=412755 RepID=X1BXR3_9ZZZZ
MSYDDLVQHGSVTDYVVDARRCSDAYHGSFQFGEKFFRLKKNDSFDALMILSARLNHDFTTNTGSDTFPGMDSLNSWMWRGFSKKARSIKYMEVFDIRGALFQPSSLIDVYTEIQAAVMSGDHGRCDMPDLGSEGCLAHLWIRNLLSNQGAYYWDGDSEESFDDVQNTLETVWLTPKIFNYAYGVPATLPLGFYHRTFEYRAEL